jgi:TfoX/Sxy family transcriptional regulator of competence genes
MAYDEDLVDRVRTRLPATEGVVELRMFGGWGATIHGNMAVGVLGDDLIVRVGPDRFDELVRKPGARPFDFTGRAMTGWVYVERTAVSNGRALSSWVERGVAFALSLPPKAAGSSRRRSTGQPGSTRPSRPRRR